jgi:hypothetical protein
MGKSGGELGADLALLYQTGEQLLPHLADQFRDAKKVLDPISGNSNPWTRDDSLGIGSSGCLTSFNDYLDAISAHLSSTALNLEATGEALKYAATDYAAADTGAKTVFEQQKNRDILDD